MSAAVLALAACSPNTTNTENTIGQTTTVDSTVVSAEEKSLFATMQIKDTVTTNEGIALNFTVYNTADTTQTFCKWHTPFEPLMSQYLSIKNEKNEEMPYKGAMAKRMMPPPADSYIQVKPKDSLSVTVDVLKGYAIDKAGKYTISYTGQNMSGLTVKDSVSFVYQR